MHKYPAYTPSSTSEPTPATIGSLLTPPASIASGGLSSLASSVNSGSSGSSAAGVPPYQPMAYWPTPQNPSSSSYPNSGPVYPYTGPVFSNSVPVLDSAPPMPAPLARHHQQQQPQQNFVGQPPYSSHQMGGPTYGHYPQREQTDRLFKCDQCPQSFNRNFDLKRHKRIHLTVKPFPCGSCEKSFSRKDALKVSSHSTRGKDCNICKAGAD